MVIVEDPSRLDGTVSYGSFVLITVDIASSIRGVTDQVAIEAAQALPRAKCLAWIRMNTSYPGSPLFYVVFLLVDRSLPGPPLSFAAVPVAPNAKHPDTGRAAVEPSRPFPWPDCCIHTLQTVTAPISRLHESPDSGIRLEGDHKKALLLACYDDADAREELENAASDSSEADDFGLPPGWRIRDHGDYGSVIYEGSGSGAGADSLSQRSAHIEQDGAARTPPLIDSSSVHGSAADAPARENIGHYLGADVSLGQPAVDDAVREDHAAGARIVLHVEVCGDLDASDDFGSAADFLSVVQRLAEIEDDRADREDAARLARAVAPKTTAWLQGVSAADGIEYDPSCRLIPAPMEVARDPVADEPQQEPEPLASSPTRDELQSSRSTPDKDLNETPIVPDNNPSRPHVPAAATSGQSLDDSIRAPSPQAPDGVPVLASSDHVRPSSSSREFIQASAFKALSPDPLDKDVTLVAPAGHRSPSPSNDAANDLEAGGLAQPASSPTKSDTAANESPFRPRTVRSLLSFLVSRFRAFIAKCRALF